VLIGIGTLIKKTNLKRGAYSKVGGYWKEGAKSNHYSTLKYIFVIAHRLTTIFCRIGVSTIGWDFGI